MAEQKAFDTTVHIRDVKSGKLLKTQSYRLRVVNGVRQYERPVGSGNLWFENGEPANEHKEYIEPTSASEMLAVAAAEAAELRAELAAIKAEKVSADQQESKKATVAKK